MGASKELFSTERIKAEMYLEDYQRLEQYQQDTIDIKAIEPEDYDYSDDEQWVGLKKKSVKAYKDLKKREFEIRNK